MSEYHKIQSIYLRDPATKFKTFLEGDYSLREFKYLENVPWTWTEKVDGTNIRVMWNGERVTFGGRTDNAQLPTGLLTRLLELFPAETMKEVFSENQIILYGEGYGNKIQAGGKYKSSEDFVLFDVLFNGKWSDRELVEANAKSLEIDVVPIIGVGNLLEAVEKVRNGITSTWGDFIAEGIVARPAVELLTRDGHRVITKIKHRDFK